MLVFVVGIGFSCGSAADSSSFSLVNPKHVSQNDVLGVSKKVKVYAEKNNRMPDSMTIKNQKYPMEEYMHLSSKTLEHRYLNKKNDVALKYNIKSPNNPSGYNISGTLIKL